MTSFVTRESRSVALLCGAVVVLLGTVNLWKVESLRAISPIDLTLLCMLAAGAAVALALLNRHFALEKSWAPLLAGFALFTPALLATSFSNPYSLTKSQGLFTICILTAATPMVLLRTEVRRLWFVRVLAGLSLVMAVWLLRGEAGLAAPNPSRLQIEDANPISVGRMACLGVVIFALTALRLPGIPRLAAVATFGVCAVAAVSTGSRGPLAAAVAAVALVSVLTGLSRSRGATVSLLAVFAIAAVEFVAHYAPVGALERISSVGGVAAEQARIKLGTESLTIAWMNWGGVGWGDLGYHLSTAARLDAQGWTQYPHNILIEALVEGGLLGLLGLVLLLAISWRRLRRYGDTLTGQILLGLWILAFGSALTSSDLIGNRLVWMMIGVGLALPTVARPGEPDGAKKVRRRTPLRKPDERTDLASHSTRPAALSSDRAT